MAKKTEGGAWINVNSDDKKGHVNIYGSDPKKPHDESIHINIDYDKGTVKINEKSNGEKSSTDANCYLTTACMKHFMSNFDDDCDELQTLRWFRNKFVSKSDIEHYYEVAPIIVQEIEKLEDNDQIYEYIYNHIVRASVDAIKKGNYDFAYNRYKSSVIVLEEKFVKSKIEKGRAFKLSLS